MEKLRRRVVAAAETALARQHYVCPIDVCVDDPDRRETEDELFARALRLHADLAPGMTLSAATSHFRK